METDDQILERLLEPDQTLVERLESLPSNSELTLEKDHGAYNRNSKNPSKVAHVAMEEKRRKR